MDRKVSGTKRDRNGNIVALCNPGQSWSPRRIVDVINDINQNRQSYYVEQVTRRRYVRIVAGNRLQTTDDATSDNNLDRLPAC